ncbi:polynucleotide 5'-hydroxyl-kinase NOL9 isoform X1 [Bombus affinis]|uniref:polynucleotide 5'-hydroxyl-kinase NOL9 isoform X1 n=1 Tax=Bombus affinis TaxID=309941 RepID=UPI0021B821FA|nr:polynucleotide 5'-hydroxyl-kinase NOL9 isoform X1 [Bombus affinis]
MKSSQTKKLKTKILKIGIKQTKAQLPQYKAQNKLVQGKRKSFLKCLNMNSLGKKNKSAQNSVLPENSLNRKQILLQCNLKRKKKKCTNIKGIQHSVDLSFQNDDSLGVQLTRDRNDQQSCNISEQKTIGSPVIVETLSNNLSLLSIPDVLKQKEQKKMKGNDFDNNPLHMQSMRNEACVIIGESLNPNDSLSDGAKDTKIVSPSKSNRKPRKDKKQLQNSSSNTTPSNSAKAKRSSDICYTGSSIHNNRKCDTLETVTSSNNDTVLIDQHLVRFYCLKNKVVAVMSKNTRFCFTGKLIVQVVYGAIEAYGYVITTQNSPIEIYSPRGYSNVLIETSEKFSQNLESNIWVSLSTEGIDQNQENQLIADIKEIQPGMAVVLLSNLENKLTRFLHVFYPFKLFPKIRNVPYHSWTNPKRAERILQSNLYIDNYACKEINIDQRITQEVTDKMLKRCRENEWSCTLIAGGKDVGKSTTMRCLINTLLPVSKMVVLVDVDPGQAECTPAECISYSLIRQPLLGPNFTHLKTPAFQLYIGDVNVSKCITRYIEGIKMLINKLSSCPVLSRLPIVVNTMGFSQGIGWDIILFTIKLIRPSFVVQIMSEKPKNNYIEYLSKEVINRQQLSWSSWYTNVIDWSRPCDHELFVIHSNAERKGTPGHDNWNMEPYQKRELVMISYLSEIDQQDSWNSARRYDPLSFSINEAVPYVTSFASLYISIPRTSVPPSHALNVVNGNIVALCGIDMNNNEWQKGGSMAGPRILNRSPLCQCYGFGIIRGVDMERQEIFINTPLPVSTMRYVNCLMGCIQVPITLLQSNQHKNVPYIGGNDVLPMSREHRRGYFRMRYQNNA